MLCVTAPGLSGLDDSSYSREGCSTLLGYGVWVTGNISPLCSYIPDPFMFLGTKEKIMKAGHVMLSEWAG